MKILLFFSVVYYAVPFKTIQQWDLNSIDSYPWVNPRVSLSESKTTCESYIHIFSYFELQLFESGRQLNGCMELTVNYFECGQMVIELVELLLCSCVL